jgi:type I restriction enzyme M protein
MSSEDILLIPSGKLRCVVSGKLRKDTPEENVRQRIARSLLDNYAYDKADIEIEFTINQGSKKPRVDIAIFPPNTEHKQENIKIIVECKREEIKPTDQDNGVEQLKSYISACLNAKYGMWVGSELQVWEKITDKNKYKLETVTDIPRFGLEAPQPLTFAELVPAQDELIDVFKRCHNYIYGNQGFQKEQAFQELLKIIFCKVYDEDTAIDTMRFFIGNQERRSEIGQRQLKQTIEKIFEEVKTRYPYIFDKEESIRLENRVLAYLVGEMQRFSFLLTEADVKGTAYEQLVGSNLRGDRGEFFTPRNVCEMASRMALLTYPKKEWLKLKIIDPTCGTGGFLVATMNVLREIIREQQLTKWRKNESKAEEETIRILKETANANLLGIDFNPILVRAAQMNLVMHGDGSTNVFHANSLLPPGEWSLTPPNDVANYVKPNSFDVIVTNPPFGSNIAVDDSHILAQFEIARLSTTGNQASGLPPEQLFIERCLYLLKPSGRLAIVLPDSILSNPGLVNLRRWILKKARIIASVDLPAVTFEPYTGTQTSVLLLQKKTEVEMQLEEKSGQPFDYEIFMTMPEAVGHDRRGNVHYLRTPQGELIEYEEEYSVSRRTADGQQVVEHRRQRKRLVHDDLPEVVKYFEQWLQENNRMEWLND